MEILHQITSNLGPKLKQAIKEIYRRSGYKNLRHIKLTIEHFGRLYSKLPKDAQQDEDLMVELMYIYSVFSFESFHDTKHCKEIYKLFEYLNHGFSSSRG